MTDNLNNKPSAFQLLCQAGTASEIDFITAMAIDEAIKRTPQGKHASH